MGACTAVVVSHEHKRQKSDITLQKERSPCSVFIERQIIFFFLAKKRAKVRRPYRYLIFGGRIILHTPSVQHNCRRLSLNSNIANMAAPLSSFPTLEPAFQIKVRGLPHSGHAFGAGLR